MRRRTFVSLLGGAAAPMAWASAANAQPVPGNFRIGLLVFAGSSSSPLVEVFRAELARLGYVEGRNLAIMFRSAEGRPDDRLPALAEEIARTAPHLIFTVSTPAALAVQQQTKTIPIVFAFTADPVGAGLVGSLSRPGGNVTGLSILNLELAGKRVEFLREILPGLDRAAVLWAGPDEGLAIDTLNAVLRQTESNARKLGIAVDLVKVAEIDRFDATFAAMGANGHRAIVILPSLLAAVNLRRFAELSSIHKLASVGDSRQFVEAGGLIAYGASSEEQIRGGARYVARILAGTRPADLPVQQPTRFETSVNLKTAKAIGLTMPPSLITRADNLIE
jgi:putative ABC transport system substrate-binding protein